jgi:hypothetical protein
MLFIVVSLLSIKKMLKKSTFTILALMVLLMMVGIEAMAQCPMCKMSAESNLAAGGTEGRGLNSGILYLLAMPYLMVGVLAFVWYRKRTVNRE